MSRNIILLAAIWREFRDFVEVGLQKCRPTSTNGSRRQSITISWVAGVPEALQPKGIEALGTVPNIEIQDDKILTQIIPLEQRTYF